jgi:two-component system LytT family response regulator
MNCIIVDDSKMARTAMKQLIAQAGFLKIKKICSSAVEAFNYLQSNEVDLIFLDVEMPGMSGIELIRNLDKRPIIILVTANRNYAVEAYELNVADYIVKPVSLARFNQAVTKAKELYESEQLLDNGNYIFIRSNSILTKLNSNGIIYLEENGKYVNIHTANERHTIVSSLKNLEEKLPLNKFYKVHNDYVVAIDRIDNVEENTAHVGTYNLPIEEQYKTGLMQKLSLLNN